MALNIVLITANQTFSKPNFKPIHKNKTCQQRSDRILSPNIDANMNMNMDINWYEHDDEINMDIPFLIKLYIHILHLQSGNMSQR